MVRWKIKSPNLFVMQEKIYAIVLVVFMAAISAYAFKEYTGEIQSLDESIPGLQMDDSSLIPDLRQDGGVTASKYTDRIILESGFLKSRKDDYRRKIVNLGMRVGLNSVKCKMDSTEMIPLLPLGTSLSVSEILIGLNWSKMIGGNVGLNFRFNFSGLPTIGNKER